MAILPTNKNDFDQHIVGLSRDLQVGLERYAALKAAWMTQGVDGQTAMGYSADDIADANALISFLDSVAALSQAHSAKGAPDTNATLFSRLCNFTTPN